MKFRSVWALAVAGACGVALPGHAAEVLRLEDAVARALGTHPSVQADAAQIEATKNRAAREGLAAPLVLGGELENVAGSGSVRGMDAAEATFRVSKILELGGKRAARHALGGAEVDAAQREADVTRVAIATRTAGRFIDVLAAQEHVEHAEERIRMARALQREVARWVSAARNPDSDLRAAEIALADAELKRDQAVQRLEASRMALASSWGSFTADFDTVAGDTNILPPLDDYQTLSERLQNAPQQRAFDAQSRILAARRDVAVSSAKPDVSVGFGLRRLEATKDSGLVMSISVPLGTRRRSAYSVSEVDYELSALKSRREAQMLELNQELFGVYQQLRQAQLEVTSVRERQLPKAEQAMNQSRRGFEEGRFSYLALSQAQKTLFDLREREVESAALYLRLLVEADRLTASAQDIRP
ncbi:TolC family protein [Stenotrophomonas muris]|uniref:TolC family protein n=1 Tax=Stenotrophomonas muris TaxID=2963283 RepID=UPI0018D2CE66|nr:TolC family protein [Stenotrophomonas maltophilia]MBH1812899.1 TolC family protein [Stenotrophomonas maltophilia]